ncbi:hypothetical protein BHE74_00026281 [Ensete ventricosum]|nr:hypothetical protein GW17_00045936 [Ensete ventricosum]RWW66349.1 hypothetical protein BHE74_00026281 [Ensete ventricosum]
MCARVGGSTQSKRSGRCEELGFEIVDRIQDIFLVTGASARGDGHCELPQEVFALLCTPVSAADDPGIRAHHRVVRAQPRNRGVNNEGLFNTATPCKTVLLTVPVAAVRDGVSESGEGSQQVVAPIQKVLRIDS